ncbi:MAG: tRNA lysidine(34) synthetase TilS [Cytophagaceae bacterium]|nr:tRNA lysidine(34) synthetase TilS [Cytophagaceae bacterium]
MTTGFAKHIDAHFPQLRTGRSILAISGGIDSIVLAHLLHGAQVSFVMAHCNFNLRGAQSDGDETFVKTLGKQWGMEVFVQGFDTTAYAEENKVSIQMAARALRYEWFEQLRKQLGHDFILTAHHANDNLETFLINLSRGAGLDGLTGIPEQNGHILRPLMPFGRDDIEAYAKENQLQWREDASNSSDKYLRNHLRHHAIPSIVGEVPHFMSNFGESQKHLTDARNLLEDYMAYLYGKIVTQGFQGYQLSIPVLRTIPHKNAVLYRLLKDFNFTAWEDIYGLMDAQTGKFVSSGTHRLIKNRDFLLLTVAREPDHREFKVHRGDTAIVQENLQLMLEAIDHLDVAGPATAYFDASLLNFPLTLRKWREGDYFYPFGMRGKKKVSKYFKDEKFSAVQKEKTWILCSGDDIIWIVGHRTDERYKVDDTNNDILKFEAKYIK